ncbi:MAG: dihydropteroate synthase [Pseudomonadota bacterium]
MSGQITRPEVMAILNVTPDSFSDGGKFDTVDTAVAQALLCEADGADILDIGAESTRPGHQSISSEEECGRLLPVLDALMDRQALPISVDTYKSTVAEKALGKGARIINDVWGLQRDERMASVVGASDASVVIMHNRFEGADDTIDIFDDMARWFDRSLDLARKAGICDDRIILDPGIGFGKTFDQNLVVLAHPEKLQQRGLRTLIGLSRKSFLGKILDTDTADRLHGTMTANLLSVAKGADIIRVHDVKPHVDMIKVLMALDGAAR